jgi:RecA/RadA recombinase
MAKKEFSFSELDKQLSKIDGFETGSILENNEFSEVSEWIPTGNYLLNAQLSGTLFGGIANNRSMGIAGDPQTGKSFLCMNIVREAQRKDYNVIYCDTEGAIDKSGAKKFGIDTNKVRYQPIKTISDFKVFVANLVDKVKAYRKDGAEPKIALILDSLGMLSTDKETGDALKGKSAMDMGIRSKELRSLFRVITLDLTAVKIPLVCTNHTTTGNIGGFMPTKEAAGGDGPIFSMSNVIMLSKAQLKEGSDNTRTGIVVTSTPKKARFTRPYPVKFHISFMNGMNAYVGLQDFVSWETCGIQRGKLEVDKKTGEMEFIPNESSPRWAVRHLGKTVPSTQIFTPEVFTDEVLKMLDEKVIQPHFKLPDLFDEKEFEDLVDGGQEENVVEDGEEQA